MEYDEYIRKDPLASGFRNLMDVSWSRNLTNLTRKFTFNLASSPAGLSRRGLDHGREMRTAFHCETAKAVAEISADEGANDNAQVDSNDDEDIL